MRKTLTIGFTLLVGAFAAAAYGAPGEWWEVTAKMEMPGMPFAMPATTTRACLTKGAAKDPHHATQDKDCQISDVKVTGNKTSYKVRCVHDGEVMNGTGEITSTPDSYQGAMRLSGTSDGEAVNMNTTYRGKRIGPACDSSQPSPEMAAAQKQIAQTCETSGRSTKDLINMADVFLARESLCPGKSKAVCDAVRKDAGKDADAYSALVTHDQNLHSGSIAIAKSCGLDMPATTKSICRTINGKNHRTLAPYCPAEVKAYRVAMRKKECEGRSYTAHEDLSRCISGAEGGVEDGGTSSGKPASGTNNPADAVIDGAKKLKGLLGF